MESVKNLMEKHRWMKIWVTVMRYIIVALIPIIAFYLMESYEHNPFKEVRQDAQVLNILLFLLIGGFLFLLTGGIRSALRIELILAMVFGLVNHYVMAFRSTPFVPWDVLSLGTAMSVAGEYDFTPTKRVVLVTLGFLALIGLLQFFKVKIKVKWPYRMVGAALVFAGLCVYTGKLQDEAFQNKHQLYPFLFTPGYMTKVNGMAVTFAMDMKYIVIEKPQGYSREEALKILERYETDVQVPEELPNIIVIMDEAFSDLSVLGELNANRDEMPFIRDLMEDGKNVMAGYANVSVCGGNTANSEFEFLTGNTMAFLPEGSIPYQQYIKRDSFSIASYLKELGYVTYGEHPYNAGGWSRDKVYPLLGIDRLLFLKDYDYRKYVRKYQSDMADVNQIIHTFETKEENSPLFLFNVTMQNHGGYTEDFENFTPDIEALDGKSRVVNKYLSLMKLTDESIEYLISYFEAQEEKTIIVFFGDHQPNTTVANPVFRYNGIDVNNLSKEQVLNRHKVPFFIWANYSIEEKHDMELSLNYLGAKVLEAADITLPAYMNFLEDLQEQYVSITSISMEESEGYEKEKAEELLKEYKILQYYYLFDRKR